MKLTERFDEALAFASRLHRNQERKGNGVPYISHLLAVTAIVIEQGGDEEESIAALLHDAVEDQGGAAMLAEIRRRFGDRVAEIVDGCSDTDEIPKPPWRDRKQAYIDHIAHASASTRLVSASDKLHNARSTLIDLKRHGDVVWDRFRGGKEGTLWYYAQLVERFRAAGTSPLVEELAAVVRELEETAKVER